MVAQLESVFVFVVLERRPIANISVIGSVSTSGSRCAPKAVHKSLQHQKKIRTEYSGNGSLSKVGDDEPNKTSGSRNGAV